VPLVSAHEGTLAEALSRVSLAEAVDRAQKILEQCDAFLRRLESAAPLRMQCSWCTPPGSPDYDPTASHGVCEAHANQILLGEPLQIAIAWLRGGDVSTRGARLAIAEKLQGVAARLDRLVIPGSGS
jgi:hypothetical protein